MTEFPTVTLDPNLGASASTPQVRPARKLRCNRVQRHPGGGIKVAQIPHRPAVNREALCSPANGHRSALNVRVTTDFPDLAL